MRQLILKGVRQNNLKNIDLELPLQKAIVLTGPSGSGKSSLAFETIYAEGQRRFMQSLSTYARQFMERFRAPAADSILNVPPTIALEQMNPVRNARATVGTTTEIYDYLRLLFEKVGIQYCVSCNLPMEKETFDSLFEKTLKRGAGRMALICFCSGVPNGEEISKLKEQLSLGFGRIVLSGTVVGIEEVLETKKFSADSLNVVVDRIQIPGVGEKEQSQSRIIESFRNAMNLGRGSAQFWVESDGKLEFDFEITLEAHCPQCGERASSPSTHSLSFNSPMGACPQCNGFGNQLAIDEERVVPNPNRTISQGAIDPFTKPSLARWQKRLLSFCKDARIDADIPYSELSPEVRKCIIDGDKNFKGVKGVFKRLERKKYKIQVRVFLNRYMSHFVCTACQGARLNPAALRVKVGGLNLAEICSLTIGKALSFIRSLQLSNVQKELVKEVLCQLERRLENLVAVGLDYLTPSRLSKSLSGGEYQRILLSTQLSQGLVDTLYVLDEPSIGLHPKDTHQLISVLDNLRSLGNSLLIVEHDPDIIQWGEYVVDLGPGSGRRGGEVVFSGPQERFVMGNTVTAIGLRSWKQDCRGILERSYFDDKRKWIEIKGASGNNLRNLDVRFPLECLVVVSGVSGSGKSTLVVDTLYQALLKIFGGRGERIAKFDSISGFDQVRSIELVDQAPIGRTSRSNPITFVKGYDEIRTLFAGTRDARNAGLKAGYFSFNIKGGRCDHCEGEGRVQVDMVFLEDVWVPCEVCDGRRFKPQVLSIKYKGKNIYSVLQMTVDEAFDFFKPNSSLQVRLALLREVGLGYIQIGQPGYSLSGGESQRLKIARELIAGRSLRRLKTLFILDEPTTGLHFDEITRLIGVFRQLVREGHSVVVIEHNLQVICNADYVIDLGPDGGENGGRVVAEGPPGLLAAKAIPHTGKCLAALLQ